tara:strand:- start:95 stop:364 length:270 start_codon:yes stop_codon:yes gene_type:complete
LDTEGHPLATTHILTKQIMQFDMSLDDTINCLKEVYGEHFHAFSTYVQVKSTQEIRTAILNYAQIPKNPVRYVNKLDIGDLVTLDDLKS